MAQICYQSVAKNYPAACAVSHPTINNEYFGKGLHGLLAVEPPHAWHTSATFPDIYKINVYIYISCVYVYTFYITQTKKLVPGYLLLLLLPAFACCHYYWFAFWVPSLFLFQFPFLFLYFSITLLRAFFIYICIILGGVFGFCLPWNILR